MKRENKFATSTENSMNHQKKFTEQMSQNKEKLKQEMLEELNCKLEEAIEAELYYKAAEYRDEIKRIKNYK